MTRFASLIAVGKKGSSVDEKVELKLVHNDGESLVTGVATTVVDASAEDCAASKFSSMYARSMSKQAKEKNITDHTTIRINDHSLYYLTTRDLRVPILGFAQRDWRIKVTWFKSVVDNSIFIYFSDTAECDETHPVKPKSVVASAHTVWKFQTLPMIGEIPQTKVIFTSKVDVGGAVPSAIMNRLVTRMVRNISDMRKLFDKSKDVDAYRRLVIVEKMTKLDSSR